MAASKYETVVLPNLILIEKWAREGATEKEIASRLGIAYSTFREYRAKYSALSALLKRGKEIVDAEVENALLEKTKGGKVLLKRPLKIKKAFYVEGKKVREEEEIVYADYEEYIIPDTVAQIYWLKNRDPAHWRDAPSPPPTSDTKGEDSAELLLKELLKRRIEGADDDSAV